MNPVIPTLLFVVLVPALVAGILLLGFGRRSQETWSPRPFLGALALGLAYLVAHGAIIGVPPVPSADVQVPARHWIAWFVLGAIVLSPFRAVRSIQRWSVPLYVALFCVLSFRFPLANQLENDAGGLAIRFGLTLAMYLVWNATELLAQRSRGFALPVGLVVAGTGIALSALFVHSASLPQQAGAVCAGLGAAGVVGLIDGQFRLPVGAVAIALIVFVGVLLNAVCFCTPSLPTMSAVLLVVAIVAPWFSELPALAGGSRSKRALVAGLSAAIPAAIAVYLAYQAGAGSDPGRY